MSMDSENAWKITMANSMFVSLARLPAGIDEVRVIVNAAFEELNLPLSKIWQESKSQFSGLLADSFVMVEGTKESDQCWVSISSCEEELTGADECTALADVKTRGSWVFAGIIAYAFCGALGRTVFNDAGELDGQESYTAESLRALLGKLVSCR